MDIVGVKKNKMERGMTPELLPKALKIPEALDSPAKCHLTTLWFLVDLEYYFAVSIISWSVTNYHSFVLNSLYAFLQASVIQKKVLLFIF